MEQLTPIERAVEYIEAHLDEDISLSDVSRETGYSYYHMTRLFSAVLGESVGRYINRRRLYNASQKLVHSDRRVIEIALESGFGSPEAFSRAFKAVFGSSPTDYRRAGLDLLVNAKRELSARDVHHIANDLSHTPELLVREETKVAGIRGPTSLFDNRTPGLWREFQRLRSACPIPGSGSVGYEICETQKTAYTKTGDAVFSVLVGCPVEDFGDLPGWLVSKTLPGGRYAVFTHRGTFANLPKTYQYIYGTWLPAAAETLDDREDFALYRREVTAFDDPDNEVKLFIPIK